MSANSDRASEVLDPAREHGRRVLAGAAQRAPAGPGVYCLLGAEAELLYIGKASNLRRRLLDHARNAAVHGEFRPHAIAPFVHEVRWTLCTDEREAVCREADLVVGLSPRFNANMAEDAFTYVCVQRHGEDRLHLRLATDEAKPPGRTYGAFSHLGKGKASWVAVRCNAGYSALLRLAWVAFADGDGRLRIPSKLRGSSPALDAVVPLHQSAFPKLHDFLTGRSRRLLDVLRDRTITAELPAFMRRPLMDDLRGAEEFYRLGPHALRTLRRRHGLPPGPVDQSTFTRIVREELRDVIGPFDVLPRSTHASLVGARLSRTMHLRAKRPRRTD